MGRDCALYELTTQRPQNLAPSWNVAPTDEAGVILADTARQRSYERMRWGLSPFWDKGDKPNARMINAQSGGRRGDHWLPGVTSGHARAALLSEHPMPSRQPLNVSLSPEFATFVPARIASGQYGSAREVVRAALCLLIAQTAPPRVAQPTNDTERR